MYSIKTDLGVSGNGTIDKDLLVKGNAVVKGNLEVEGTVDFKNATFTQIQVSGNANLTNIISTGTSSLKDVNVTGNTVLGDDSTDTVTVNATSTFSAPVVLKGNITQQAGTASLKDVSATSITVSGESTLNGNLNMGTGTKATMKDLETDTLKVNGDSIIGGTLSVTGASTFSDVVINGTLSGTYTMDAGNFNSIKVAQLSDLNNVNIKGSTTLTGNVTGTNSTVSINHVRMLGSDAIVDFSYNDPSRPTDIKSSIEPYQISSNNVVSKSIKSDAANIGVVGGTSGLHAIGKATIDYLKIAGNSTIGTATPQLEVTGKSILGDVDFTGTVTGLTVDVSGQDITPNSVIATAIVQGAQVKSVGQITGDSLQIAGISTFQGNGNFSETLQVKDLIVTGTTTGVTSEANVDGLDIKPNSVISTTSIKGATVESTGNLTVNGSITTTNANLSISKSTVVTGSLQSTGTITSTSGNIVAAGSFSGASISVIGPGTALSTTNNAIIGGTLTVNGNTSFGGSTGKTTIHDLVVTGTTTGVSVVANVDGLDIKPKSVIATTSVKSATLEVTGAAIIGGTLSGTSGGALQTANIITGTITANGNVNVPAIDVSNNGIIRGNFTVNGNTSFGGSTGTTNVHNLVVTGTTTGVTAEANVDGLDIKPKSILIENPLGSLTVSEGIVTTVDALTAGNIDASGLSLGTDGILSAGNANISGTLETSNLHVNGDAIFNNSVTMEDILAVNSIDSQSGTLTLQQNTIASVDLTVKGIFKPEGGLDLTGTALNVESLTTTGNATIGGNLAVTGTFNLSNTDVTVKSLTSPNLIKGQTFTATGTGYSVLPYINATSRITSPEGNFASLTGVSTAFMGTVTASTIDTANIKATNNVLIDGTLGVTSPTGTLHISSNVLVDKDLTVSGVFTPAGGLDISGADITANKLTTTTDVIVGQLLTVGSNATITGNGRVGSLTVDNGATITSGNLDISSGTITSSGAGRFGAVLSNGSITASSGHLTVSSGNIYQNGAASSTASFKKTSTTNLHVGTLVWDEESYIAEVGGNAHISGDLDVDGTINAAINLTGRDISPRSITTSQGIQIGTTLDVTGQSTMASAIIGEASSENNNLQVNGNVVCTGDFTVQGRIIGTLDQTTSDVTVKSLTSTTFVKGATLESSGVAKIGGKLTVSAGGVSVTGGTTTDTLSITTTTTASGKVTVSAGGVAVTGGTTTDTLTVSGISTLDAVNATSVTSSGTLSVTGASTFTGKVTAGNLESTGLITAKDLTITGTLNTDIANLVTQSVTTGKYLVKAKGSETVGATWTPDGSSNVYNITLTAAQLSIASFPYTPGYAGSWFIYVTQDATGSRAINWNAPFGVVGDSVINPAPNSVSICQIVYSGVGDILDVFIAQRNL